MRFKPLIIQTTGEVVFSYNQYLNSKHWDLVKQHFAQISPRYCVLCGRTDNLNIHHKTYERLGCESPYDLVYLCETCHRNWHFYLNYQKHLARMQRYYSRKF